MGDGNLLGYLSGVDNVGNTPNKRAEDVCHPLFFWLEACSGLEVAGFCGGVMDPKAFAAGHSWNVGLPCICGLWSSAICVAPFRSGLRRSFVAG